MRAWLFPQNLHYFAVGVPTTSHLIALKMFQYCSVDRKSTLIQSIPLGGGLDSISRLRKNGVSVGFEDCRKTVSRRKLALEAKYRVQDTVDNGAAVTEEEIEYKKRNRERIRRQRYGERRRRVQILSNNGVVDLEQHLGMIKDDETIAQEDSPEQADERVAGLADEEGRRLLESSLLGNDVDELRGTDDSINSVTSTSSNEGSFSPSQARRSERGLYSSTGATQAVRSQGPQDVIEVELSEEGQGPRVRFRSDREGRDIWVKSEAGPRSLAQLPGGRRVVELVAAWDGLAGRLPPEFLRTSGSDLLLRALKLTVMALQHTSPGDEGRTPLRRSLAVAHTLADLGMDAEVISTGLLREVLDLDLITNAVVEENLGGSIARLLRDCSRVRQIPSRADSLDDDSAKALRQFCLAFHDVSAVVVELASQLDTMRNIHSIPRYRQQILALETMQIYAPLAHAIGTSSMALELEDLGFRVLFPDSYSFIENWLRSHWVDGSLVVDQFKEQLLARLEQDVELQSLVTKVNVLGRYKSRFSTMRKLLRDGRKPEEVYDVLGLRVILEARPDDDAIKQKAQGVRACYRAFEVATSMWEEVPGRLKDYIAHRKENGYESLHLAVRVNNQMDRQPPMEIQIRTAEMDAAAVSGDASHAFYKGGMTDPEQVSNLKLLMVAAANAAASRFGEIAGSAVGLEGVDSNYGDRDKIFKMFDKNQDGVISVEEFGEVISELGADEGDALELMKVVDLNIDGFVSVEEFSKFRNQIQISQNLAGVDRQFSSQLGTKLQQSSVNEAGEKTLASRKLSQDVVRFIAQKLEAKIGSKADTKLPSQQSISSPSEQVSEEAFNKGRASSLRTSTMDISGSRVSTDIDAEEVTVGRESTAMEASTLGNSAPSDTKSLPRKVTPKLVKPVLGSGIQPSLTTMEVSDSSPMLEEELTQRSGSKIPKVEELQGVENNDEDDSDGSTFEQELSTIRELTGAGEFEAARMLAVQLSRKYPGNTKALLHQASLERKCGHLRTANHLYSQAVDIFNLKGDLGIAYVRALHAWASLEGQAGNGVAARRLYAESVDVSQQGAIDSSLRGAGVYGLHGWARLEQKSGNWSTARDLLERAANLQPGNAVIHQSRASLEAYVHNYSAARVNFQRAVEAAPEDVKCWHAWATFEASRRNIPKMRELFQRALEVDPKNVHSLQAWARHEGLLGSKQSRTRARKLYQNLVDITPNSIYCWQSWGILEQDDENFDEARALFKRGLELNKDSVPCLQAFAHMERKCGNLGAAVILLRRALAMEPSNAAALMELALIEDTVGNEDGALELFKQAAKGDRVKSLVKRRMFESRKRENQVKGIVPKYRKRSQVQRYRPPKSSMTKEPLQHLEQVEGYRPVINNKTREPAQVPEHSSNDFKRRTERVFLDASSGPIAR